MEEPIWTYLLGNRKVKIISSCGGDFPNFMFLSQVDWLTNVKICCSLGMKPLVNFGREGMSLRQMMFLNMTGKKKKAQFYTFRAKVQQNRLVFYSDQRWVF